MSTVLTIGAVGLDTLSVLSLDLSDGWQFPDHDVVETKPRLQWTGTQLRTISVGLRFHAQWCDPAARMGALRGLGESVRAWPVMRGSGAWLGRFVVTALKERDRWALPNGTPLRIEANLELTEWAGLLGTAGGTGAALARAIASPLLRRRG